MIHSPGRIFDKQAIQAFYSTGYILLVYRLFILADFNKYKSLDGIWILGAAQFVNLDGHFLAVIGNYFADLATVHKIPWE